MNKEVRKKLKEAASVANMKFKDYLIENKYCLDCGSPFEPKMTKTIKGVSRRFRVPTVIGLTTKCSVRCEKCLYVAREIHRRNKITRVTRRRKEGMCIQCGKNPPSEATWQVGYYIQTIVRRPSELCTYCREKNRERRNGYYYPREHKGLSNRKYRVSYRSDSYIQRVKDAGLCIRCKGRSGLAPRPPFYTCDKCRDILRRESRERYVPAYSMKLLESLKVGDKFPLTRTTNCRHEYKQGIITSIDRAPDGVIDRINLNIGHYDLYHEYHRKLDKFNLNFVEE